MKKTIMLLLAALVLAACAPAAIAGEWTLTSYGDPSNPTLAAPDIETSITFGKDGNVNGTAGCNTFAGGYTTDGKTIAFDPLAATLMFCEGAAGEQEMGLFNAFTGTTSYTLSGNTLTVVSEDGSAAVTLTRK